MSATPNRPEPLVYTVEEARHVLRLSRTSVCKLIYSGKLPHRKVGTRVLIPRAAVERFLGVDNE